ncbi:MAG: hypothetical protein KA352_03965 [Flavobacteriales bacterium]|nr:hypothetical protein [Flavobacteriales bacterium]
MTNTIAFLRLPAAIVLLVLHTGAMAATVTSNGTGGGNWSVGGSWAGGAVPLATDHVVIAAGDQVNLNSDRTCVNLTVHGVLNLNTNTRTLTVNGSLTFTGVGSTNGNGASRVVNVGNGLVTSPGATTSISGFTLAVTGASAVQGSLTFTSAASSRTFNSDVTVTGSLLFTANTTVNFVAKLIAGNGAVIGGGGSTGTLAIASDLQIPAAASATIGSVVLTCNAICDVQGNATLNGGTFQFNAVHISGSGVLDVSPAVNTIAASGNWINTSSAGDPYVEGTTSPVTLNGAIGTQQITASSGTETFFDLIIANTSVTSPAIAMGANVAVTNDLDHSSGVLDLAGYALTLTGSPGAETHAFNGATMITSVNGGAFTVTDPSNVNRITFTNYRMGDNVRGVTTNVTCGRISFVGFTQWGTAFFTKTLNVDDVFGGGNYYHGPVTFTADPSASRWRMGDNLALPDTFVNASFRANALGGTNNNFILGANSHGNAFYGLTRITSTTIGGVFICRQNGNGTSSATFHGPVVARVTLTGNITFADSDSAHANVVTFHDLVQSQSATTSTGDIYYGNSGYSTVNVSPTGQFIPGTVQGMTSIHFRKVTQTGSLQQSLLGISNSRVYCGGAAYPNVFNGPVDLKADTLQVAYTTFHANCDLTGLSHVTTAHSTYNGPTNTFTKQGSGNSSCVGGNTFDAGSTNTFYNYGTGYFRLANSVPDDMNGIARYQQHGSGALLPAYGTACTYSNNISTVATLTAIQFGVGGGTVVLDGTNQTINGEAVQPPLFYRLNLSHSGTLTLLTPTAVRNTFTMNSGLTNLNGNTLTLGISTGTPGTLSYTAGWCYGGTLTRWLNNTAIAVGGVNGHFPMGSSTTDYRPLWFGSTVNLTAGGTLSVQHSPTTSGSNAASHADASWGNTVLGVSNAAWTITRANGLTVNGSTARLRYGGTGFDPFVLTDLNASLASSVVGTFAAATSTVVPLEVNRTALNSAAVGNTWMIGTRNLSQSPLPVELLYFTATPSGPDVLLAWATATEHNNDHFVVERSPNAEDWEAIAMLSGAGNSLSTLTYSHRDNDPLPGTSYYRLQQVDHDGTSTFSQAVSVRMNSPRTVTAFPNPTTGLIHIAGLSATESIALTDMKGGVQKVPIERDGNVITLDGRDLAAGIYQVLTAAGALRVSISP